MFAYSGQLNARGGESATRTGAATAAPVIHEQ
jgi:hypothetical protein